jgi:dipeptidyl aminopeptidase/acylaminoacyl peptidase
MRRSLIILVSLILLAASSGLAQDQSPYTFEDHISMKRLSSPALSPDGKWVAYSQSQYSLEKNSGKTEIYLVSIDGGDAKFLATGSGPVWSPCSKFIAFNRSGQIWVINVTGGEARQITEMATGAGGPKWSPDGSKILFASMVWPGLSPEENAKRLEEFNNDPVKAFATESLLFRHWDTWRGDGRKSQLHIVDVKTGETTNLFKDFPFDVPPFPFGGSGDYTFSPDGSEIAFVAKASDNPAWNTNLDVFTMKLDGEPVNITEENKAQDSGPVVYSPDGKFLAYGAMERPTFEADRIQLTVHEFATGSKTSLTADLDASAGEWTWTGDGEHLYFTAGIKARRPILRTSLADGTVATVIEGHTMHGVAVHENTVVFSRQSMSAPVDLYKYDLDSGKETQLTEANKELLAGIEMAKVEERYFKGANDEDVQMMMLYPPGFDESKEWPLIILIHGGPQGVFGDDFHYRWNAQLFAAPGYVVSCINFHGSTSFGQEFTDSISKNWGGLPYTDIIKGLEVLTAEPYIDADRVGAAGGSYGGYMINWIATQTDKFAALVSHAGVYNLESMYGATEELWFPEWEFDGPFWENREYYDKWSPHRFAANLGKFKTPVLVVHGQHDYRVIVTQGFEMFTALQRQGVESRLLYYPDETHFVLKPKNAQLWYKEVHDWYKRFIGVGPAE